MHADGNDTDENDASLEKNFHLCIWVSVEIKPEQ